jgi:hypothetical protein
LGLSVALVKLPLDLIETYQGLAEVNLYLDAMRAHSRKVGTSTQIKGLEANGRLVP